MKTVKAPSKKVREYLCQKLGLSNQLMAGEVTEVEMKRTVLEAYALFRVLNNEKAISDSIEMVNKDLGRDYSISKENF